MRSMRKMAKKREISDLTAWHIEKENYGGLYDPSTIEKKTYIITNGIQELRVAPYKKVLNLPERNLRFFRFPKNYRSVPNSRINSYYNFCLCANVYTIMQCQNKKINSKIVNLDFDTTTDTFRHLRVDKSRARLPLSHYASVKLRKSTLFIHSLLGYE